MHMGLTRMHICGAHIQQNQKGIDEQEPPDLPLVQSQVLHKTEDSSDGIELLANT